MRLNQILSLACAFLLSACGGSGASDTEPEPPAAVETQQVHISAHGEGTLQDAMGVIACESHECEKAYPRGQRVLLTATPKAGWNFERWSGCDAVTGSQCAITTSADRQVAPVFVRTVETKLQDNVRSLNAQDESAIVKYEAGVLTLSKSAPMLAGLKVGDIVLSQAGEGMARRVAKIVDIPGGATILDTTAVAITDVISQGSYYYNSKAKVGSSSAAPLRRQALRIVPQQPGVRPQAAWDGSYDAKNTVEVNVPLDAKKSIKGSIDLTLNLEAAIDITFPGVLQEFRLAVNPTIEPKLALVGDFGTVKGEVDLFRVLGAPVVMGPVVLVPEFIVKVAYEGKIEVEVNFVSSFKTTGSAGFTYLKGYGARKIWTAAADSAPFSPAGTGTISFDMMGALQAGTKFWGVAGPKLEVGPYFNIEGSLSTADDCAKVEAEIGVRGRVGGEIRVASWELGEWEWVIAELPLKKVLERNLTAGCNKLPAAPTGLSVTPRGADGMNLSWVAPSASESVVAYEIYRQGRMVTRVSATTYVDTGLLTDTEYCYDVRSRNVDGKVSVASTAVCRRTLAEDTQPPSAPIITTARAESTTSASVSWQASTDNVGVVRYVLLVNGTVIDSTTDTNLSVLRLQPAKQYCFKVRAFDAAGNTSTDSAQHCVTTLAPELAAWTLMLKCVNQSTYVVSKRIDIDLQAPNNVSTAGDAQDYDGSQMSYHLFGGYDSGTGQFAGRIDWTFADSAQVREDDFTLRLNLADTGDVPMNQIKVTGCDAAIRLVRN